MKFNYNHVIGRHKQFFLLNIELLQRLRKIGLQILKLQYIQFVKINFINRFYTPYSTCKFKNLIIFFNYLDEKKKIYDIAANSEYNFVVAKASISHNVQFTAKF
jgi:hypothetical protein